MNAPQVTDQCLEAARLEPALRLLIDRLPRWQVVRQHPPCHAMPRLRALASAAH
jgi:hypothetical protein